jgi:hypothetical protein
MLDTKTLDLISQQLGRTPRGIRTIAAQSAHGIPLVLEMESLVDDKPFPTLYWLCSKSLCKEIGRIETTGWVKDIEERLQNEPDLRARFLDDQKSYITKRWQRMSEQHQQRIQELGFERIFKDYGIGGIAQLDKVRCLHMQYAHHLVDGNIIGQLLDEQFDLQSLPITL